MKESDIPEEQFEQFIDMYAGNYVKENLEDLIATGQKAFPMQQLNFGMIYTKYLPDVVDSLNNVIRSLDEQGLIALVESRMAAQSFNPAFGEQYGKFYVDTVSLTKMMKENVQNESVKTALEDFKKAIYKAEPKKIVINGDGNIDSARISLLFPEKTQLYGLLDKYYKPLDFSEVSLWDELLGVIAQAMQQQQQPQQEESVETHEGVEREFDIKF
jgi:hypothetical protein